MKKIIAFVLLIGIALPSLAGYDITPYKIYKQNGKRTSYRKMIKAIRKSDVTLFGELHNNPICHWLQYETSKDFVPGNRKVAFGAEMIEADNQDALNEYLNGNIDAAGLDSLARLWPNYETDYAPLVNLAKEYNIPFIATNSPRRHASAVYSEGFDALDKLSDKEKEWIAPLPIPYDPELPGYKAMLEMGMNHGGENLPKAQAVKDATMGYFISQSLKNGFAVLHYNGTYHSDDFEGILYYILLQSPDVEFTTISSVLQENVHKLEKENIGKANFILCIDENMTPTY